MGDELRGPLEHLGRKIAEAEDTQLEAVVQRARARFEAHPARSAPRALSAPRPAARAPGPRFVVRRAWVAAAAAALVVALLVVRARRSAPPGLEAGSRGGAARTTVLASSTEASLRFSDGSTVDLAPDAHAHVVELTTEGARVAVERGRAVVSVPVRAGARWSFDVGPFALVASGASFETSWDPETRIFQVEPREGSLHVSGPTVRDERVLVAGQNLRIALAIGEDAVRDPPARPEAAPEPAPATASPSASASATEPGPAAVPGARPAAGVSAPRPVPAGPSWRALSADGRYAEAMMAVGSTFDALCASEGSGDVIVLGDTARLAGDPARAARAYESARARFPGSSDGALAAFALGRMAAQRGNDPEAARWFATYLRERPGDRLAREALGRLMEARERNGETASARVLAGEYLAKYPDGPHAKLARKIQGE